MNLEAIIRMARESGLAYGSDENVLSSVMKFFMAATIAERKACAKVCNDQFKEFQGLRYFSAASAAKECESAILARGES